MKCPYCGAEIEEGLDICPVCGKSLSASSDEAEKTENKNEEPAEVPEETEVNEEKPETEEPAEEKTEEASGETEVTENQETAEIPEENQEPAEEQPADTSEPEVQEETPEEKSEPDNLLPAVTDSEPYEKAQTEEPAKEKKGLSVRTIILIAAVALFVLAAGGMYFLQNMEKPADKVLRSYHEAQNQVYDVKSASELSQVYRTILERTIPNESYFEMMEGWYGVTSKDELYAEMADMAFPSIRDMDPVRKSQSKYTWTVLSKEQVTLDSVWDIFGQTTEIYQLVPESFGEIWLYNVQITDLSEEPITIERTYYVYQYDKKWYLLD